MSWQKEGLEGKLFALQDLKYQAFQCRLMPTVDPETVIGVRTPALRELAKEFGKTPEAAPFLQDLPHRYSEENNLHRLLLSAMKDYEQIIPALDAFLPFVDNWATCDLISPKVFKKHLPDLLPEIRRWMASGHTYTVRFGIGMLMSFYLDGAFQPEYLDWVAAVRSQEYYVNMMIAWYFATALAKQYESTLPYIEYQRMDTWTHNRAIQKAIESDRITDQQKTYLRTLKRKTPKAPLAAEKKEG